MHILVSRIVEYYQTHEPAWETSLCFHHLIIIHPTSYRSEDHAIESKSNPESIVGSITSKTYEKKVNQLTLGEPTELIKTAIF